MKLYLTSYRVPNPDDLFSFIGGRPEDIKVAIIPNAKDYYATRARDYKINEIVNYWQSLGASPKVFDLNATNESTLKIELPKYDLLWLTGGNTFCLNYAIHKSGFNKVIKEVLKHNVVFAGESAGAIVAGTSLKGVELADEPEFTDKPIYTGLCLVPYTIIPHSDNEMFAESNVATKKLHKTSEIIEITDSQAIKFENGKYSIIN